MSWFALFTDVMIKYGLLGLYVQSFMSSLVFIPGFVEFVVPLYVGLKFNPFTILIIVSLGSILGEIVNYYLGFFGSKIILKNKKEIRKTKKWLNKWGDLSVFVASFLPIPFDFIAVAVGFLRMDLKTFSIAMGLGKVLKYALIIFGIEILWKALSVYGLI